MRHERHYKVIGLIVREQPGDCYHGGGGGLDQLLMSFGKQRNLLRHLHLSLHLPEEREESVTKGRSRRGHLAAGMKNGRDIIFPRKRALRCSSSTAKNHEDERELARELRTLRCIREIAFSSTTLRPYARPSVPDNTSRIVTRRPNGIKTTIDIVVSIFRWR